ncbi:MAG: glycosyltransferase family 4 protein [Acidobacteria bacterium]|nr:glycosyltransferase family 4 protein [Acidobacteriota bacterium]
MRILYCSSFYPPAFVGGAELIAHEHAARLRAHRHAVGVFAGAVAHPRGRWSLTQETYEGLPVWRVGIAQSDFDLKVSAFFDPRIDALFENVLDAFRPDVIHMHNLVGLSMGMLSVARRRGLRCFLTVHDHWGFCFKNTLLRPDGRVCTDFSRCSGCFPTVSDCAGRTYPMRLRRDFVRHQARLADGFVSPSYYLACAYVRAGFPVDKFSVIPYGVAHERFRPKADREPAARLKVGFVGYLGDHKGVAVLIEAVARAQRRGELDVVVAGEGHLQDTLEERVRREGLQHIVRFAGKLDNQDVRQMHESLDVLVVPSIWPENSPVTIYEAFAGGTAVVASRTGGIPELVHHGVTGLLFEPGSAAELAAALDRLAGDRGLAERLGRQACNAIRPVSLSSAANQLERLYQSAHPAPSGRANERLVIVAADPARAEWKDALARCDADERFESVRFLFVDWVDEQTRLEAEWVWAPDVPSVARLAALGLADKPRIAPDGAALREALAG